jgi:hypothetical protein
MKTLASFVMVFLLASQAATAQPAAAPTPPPPAPVPVTQKKFGPKKQAAIIIFAGLGGAVLGLSTLSFYGRPQDKLANIAIGAAVGIMVGTIYVTYKAATQPSEFYGESYDQRGANLITPNYNNPHQLSRDPPAVIAGYRWQF